MSNQLKNQTGDLLVGGTEAENILGAAKEDSGFEALLKFKKGEYFIGDDEVLLGTEYIAHAIAWTKCWIKFVDGDVVERHVYRVAKNERPPEREDLDDLDKDNWPAGLDGHPADPWSYQYLLPFESIETGEIVIFTTSSFGGRRAVGDVCTAWAKRSKKAPHCGQPIIKLDVVDMPTKKFGKVPRPHFEIVGWDEPSKDSDVPPSDDEFGKSGGGFNDEVPFAPCI
jgi:hypothetical protein